MRREREGVRDQEEGESAFVLNGRAAVTSHKCAHTLTSLQTHIYAVEHNHVHPGAASSLLLSI